MPRSSHGTWEGDAGSMMRFLQTALSANEGDWGGGGGGHWGIGNSRNFLCSKHRLKVQDGLVPGEAGWGRGVTPNPHPRLTSHCS